MSNVLVYYRKSCHHVPADDAGRIKTGRRILPKVNLKGDLVPQEVRMRQGVSDLLDLHRRSVGQKSRA